MSYNWKEKENEKIENSTKLETSIIFFFFNALMRRETELGVHFRMENVYIIYDLRLSTVQKSKRNNNN